MTPLRAGQEERGIGTATPSEVDDADSCERLATAGFGHAITPARRRSRALPDLAQAACRDLIVVLAEERAGRSHARDSLMRKPMAGWRWRPATGWSTSAKNPWRPAAETRHLRDGKHRPDGTFAACPRR